MTFEKKVNREKAITLRKLGWKYQDIAQELGCSREWCCRNLKDIEPDIRFMKQAYIAYLKEPFVFEDNLEELEEGLYKNETN